MKVATHWNKLCTGAAGKTIVQLDKSLSRRSRNAFLAAVIAMLGVRTASAEEPAAAPSRDPKLEDPSTYEIAFMSVGIAQAVRLGNSSLFIGGGGGLGPSLFRFGQLKCAGSSTTCDDRETRDLGWDPTLEIVYGNAFVRYSPTAHLDLDVGPKIGISSTQYGVPDAPRSTFSYGFYGDLRVGTETIKLGPRFEFYRSAYADFYEMGWRITPLMLRIIH